MTDTGVATLTEHAWTELTGAHTQYAATVPGHYDEVLHEVAHRVATSGSIGKADIEALLFWKRLRADAPACTSRRSRTTPRKDRT